MKKQKKIIILIVVGILVALGVVLLLKLWNKPKSEPAPEQVVTEREASVGKININVNNHDLGVRLTGNSSAQALYDKLAEGPITIKAEDYGGFEKVGELEFKLPENNEEMTAKIGDLILFEGDKISLYYEVNVYSLTKLGEVDYALQPELQNILGDGPVTMVLTRVD